MRAVVACMLVSAVAGAQTTGPDGALAEALYQEGRQLMQQGQYAEACPKFAESHRLDPATGTLLNLAACHEAEQKLTSAWIEFAQAETLARRDHRDDRVRYAHERSAALEPRLARVKLVLDHAIELTDLEVTVDGVAIRGPARQIATPLDPGVHLVEAHAAGRRSWSQRIVIDQQPALVLVAVPSLVPIPVEPPARAAAQPASSQERDHQEAPRLTGIYLVGGVAAGLAVGAVISGYGYMRERARTDDDYSEQRLRRWGYVNIAFVAGALLAGGAGTYAYLTRSPSATPRASGAGSRLQLSPWLGCGGAGLQVGGAL